MSRLDLTNKYGKNKNLNSAINAAIREEIAGGHEILEALPKIRERAGDPLYARLLPHLRDLMDIMAGEIRQRYGLEPR